MVSRLEDKIYKTQHKGVSYIHFEKNELLKGLEFIDPLHKAIINSNAIEVEYQSFKARESKKFIFHPYLLKEYRNRWFVLGQNSKKLLLTLALDRIISVNIAAKEKYYRNEQFDINTYFDDVIGVSKIPSQKTHLVVFKVNKFNEPYIKTKPIHPSQSILKEEKDGMIFSINVVWNFELEREILGFGEAIKVLAPKRLRNKITQRLREAFEGYKNLAE